MATALFVSITELKRFTALNGNIDDDKLLQFVKIAQDIHICSYLGTRLYTKFKTDILNDNLAEPYTSLLANYISPMVIHWAMVEILPFIAYNISNKGITRLTGENSQTVDKDELNILIDKEREIAQNYTRKFIDYMVAHPSSFPEYLSVTTGEHHPITSSDFGGWLL